MWVKNGRFGKVSRVYERAKCSIQAPFFEYLHRLPYARLRNEWMCLIPDDNASHWGIDLSNAGDTDSVENYFLTRYKKYVA